MNRHFQPKIVMEPYNKVYLFSFHFDYEWDQLKTEQIQNLLIWYFHINLLKLTLALDHIWPLPLNEHKPKHSWSLLRILLQYFMGVTYPARSIWEGLHQDNIQWQPTYDFLSTYDRKILWYWDAIAILISLLRWVFFVYEPCPYVWWLQITISSFFVLWK